MVTKQDLKGYIHLVAEIHMLDTELRDLHDSIGPRSPVYGSRKRRIGLGDLSIPVARIVDFENKLKRKRERLIAERCRMEDALEVLTPDERVVIRMRYFHGLSWIQIQNHRGQSEAHIHRIHGAALRKLNPRYSKKIFF